MSAAAIKREFGPHPLTIIREAIANARIVGAPVRIGSLGVECVPDRHIWRRDPREDGVDPIGAAILHRQPRELDVDLAAAAAVNATIPWVEGCRAGMARSEPSSAWSTSVQAGFYAAGYQAGTWLRVQLLHNVEAPAGGGKV